MQYLLNKEWFDDLDNHRQCPKYVGCNLHNVFIAMEVDALPIVAKWKLVLDLSHFSGCLRISKILDGILSHGFEVHDYYDFSRKIESVQYNAALAITGCIRGSNRERHYSELGLNLFSDRINHMTPDYLSHCISGSIRRSLTTRTNRYDVY